MKTIFPLILSIFLGFAVVDTLHADPQLTTWFTTCSGRYARIYTNTTMELAGDALTTWSNGSETQSLPAYDGVQEIDYSSDYVYARSTGLASYTMGPWSVGFPNLPSNQKTIFRIPRSPAEATSVTLNGGGAIGIFVDGVAMFNSWDAFYWSGTADTGAMGTGGYWNRDAFVNEGSTFDPAYAHQQQSGTYHYHANPIGLRYLLGDHVNWNSVSNIYSESTAPVTKHSPILAWVADGYPLYGPYGYSNPTNSASGVRRMISGYVARNGQNGSDNISTTGSPRTYLPAWALRFYASAGAQNGTTNGPTVSSSYPFGRYMEDNAYLGDLTNPNTGQPYQQGTDFDLDEYNGRYCVTPEFPNGTYAYFVSIASNGTPVFPYNIGHAFYGKVTGGTVSSITETVTTNYVGGPSRAPVLNTPKVASGTVTLTWSATEGGTYMVQSSSNLNSWTTNSTNVSAVLDSGSYTGASAGSQNFFRVARTALASYDPVSGTSGGGGGSATITLSPASGTSGMTYTIMATLASSDTPPVPPHSGAPIASFTIGANTVTGASYVYNADGSGTVTGSITLTTGTGAQTATITFSPPPGQTQGPTYTQANAFTIH